MMNVVSVVERCPDPQQEENVGERGSFILHHRVRDNGGQILTWSRLIWQSNHHVRLFKVLSAEQPHLFLLVVVLRRM